MKVSVILAHPYDKSFNYGIKDQVLKTLNELGHEVYFHDLYSENFNPVMTGFELENGYSQDPLVEEHCKEIIQADGIVIIHPNWWGQPPAILKGWVDRVLRYNLAYKDIIKADGKVEVVGLLTTNQVIIINTGNTDEDSENNIFLDPLETLWKNCVFGFCGAKNVHRMLLRIVAESTPEIRAGWLLDIDKTLRDLL
jgi:putative NADPH-quinone reductase